MKKLATLALLSLTCSLAIAQTQAPAAEKTPAKTTAPQITRVTDSALLHNDSTKYCLYDGKQYSRGARIKGVQGDLLKCAPSDLYSKEASELEWTPLI